MSDYKLHN